MQIFFRIRNNFFSPWTILQISLFKLVQILLGIQITEEEQAAVGWAVPLSVTPQVFLISQIDYVKRLSAGVELIGGSPKQIPDQIGLDDGILRAHGSAHLVEDNPVELAVQMPDALLKERLLPQKRSEYCIGIDVEQDVEVLLERRCEGIHRLVAECHRIEECVGAGEQDLRERILDGKPL